MLVRAVPPAAEQVLAPLPDVVPQHLLVADSVFRLADEMDGKPIAIPSCS
jgi:hypothetical protein